MLAILSPKPDGLVEGIRFDSMEEMFEHLLLYYGPDCQIQHQSPDEGLNFIFGFSSDGDFNNRFQQYILEESIFRISCPQCGAPEHSCCCGGCVETY